MKVRCYLSSALHLTSFRNRGATTTGSNRRVATRSMLASSSASASPPSSEDVPALSSVDKDAVERRLRNALWSFFAGDALAAPTHWYYGGFAQIRQHYGPDGIVGYTKPSFELPGSIMNKSDPNGGGRSKSSGWFGRSSSSSSSSQKTIIGDVINHGKLELWDPSRQIHYHATLAAGENTLEAQLGRVLMKSMVETGGVFDANHFQKSYVKFMTTPGSHNDAYASTCHRMFFANMVFEGKPPHQCPDNDGHNVETVDALILPTVVGLAAAARSAAQEDGAAKKSWRDEVARQAAECVRATRKSKPLERAAAAWSQMVGSALFSGSVVDECGRVAASMGYRQPRGDKAQSSLTACYLDSALPALLDDVVAFERTKDRSEVGATASLWRALLRNANTGGENVHRGSCLGAVLGSIVSSKASVASDPELAEGLHDRHDLAKEIDDFVNAVMVKNETSEKTYVQHAAMTKEKEEL